MYIWVTEGGDLSTADWGCLAGRCASLCLQAAHGGRAAGGLEACLRRCAVQIDDLYLYFSFSQARVPAVMTSAASKSVAATLRYRD